MAEINEWHDVPPQTAKLIMKGLDEGMKLKVAELFNNYLVAETGQAAHDRFAADLKYCVEGYEEIKAELEATLAPSRS